MKLNNKNIKTKNTLGKCSFKLQKKRKSLKESLKNSVERVI